MPGRRRRCRWQPRHRRRLARYHTISPSFIIFFFFFFLFAHDEINAGHPAWMREFLKLLGTKIHL